MHKKNSYAKKLLKLKKVYQVSVLNAVNLIKGLSVEFVRRVGILESKQDIDEVAAISPARERTGLLRLQ